MEGLEEFNTEKIKEFIDDYDVGKKYSWKMAKRKPVVKFSESCVDLKNNLDYKVLH